MGDLTVTAVHELSAGGIPIRRIPAKSGSIDPVERAKSHWLGRFYVRHLKPYSLLRYLVNRVWLVLFPIYRLLNRRWVRSRNTATSMPFVAQSVFVHKHAVKKTVLAAPHEVITPAPRAYPQGDQHHLKSPHEQYTFPETIVAELRDALVQGGTNIVVAKDCAIHHDLFTRVEDYTSEELHERMELDLRAGTVVWRAPDPQPETLEVAANFVDACAQNYAHWLTEVAPRIALLCAKPEFDGVPLIVNDGLHLNIMESLFTLAAGKHPIIALPMGRSVKVERLYLVSCAGYVPFEPRGGVHVAGMSHGKFSQLAFEAIRHACFTSMESHPTPSKIFLRRNSGMRRLLNSDAIESLLIGRGFTVVEPEKLNFAMQVQLFQQAKVIIGPTGAALANIVFCETKTQIAILINRQEDTFYWYWQNIACSTKNEVKYIFGHSKNERNHGIHADFSVPLQSIEEFLS